MDILGCVGPSAGHCSYFLNAGKPTGLPILVHMPAGVGATALEQLSDADSIAHVLAVLRRMFPGVEVRGYGALPPLRPHRMLIGIMSNKRVLHRA